MVVGRVFDKLRERAAVLGQQLKRQLQARGQRGRRGSVHEEVAHGRIVALAQRVERLDAVYVAPGILQVRSHKLHRALRKHRPLNEGRGEERQQEERTKRVIG